MPTGSGLGGFDRRSAPGGDVSFDRGRPDLGLSGIDRDRTRAWLCAPRGLPLGRVTARASIKQLGQANGTVGSFSGGFGAYPPRAVEAFGAGSELELPMPPQVDRLSCGFSI